MRSFGGVAFLCSPLDLDPPGRFAGLGVEGHLDLGQQVWVGLVAAGLQLLISCWTAAGGARICADGLRFVDARVLLLLLGL